MDEARRLAQSGCEEGTVVVAEEQTAARGRFDRRWVSPPGENLCFSVILKRVSTSSPYANMAAALAVVRAVGSLDGLWPSIKWPNDVRVGGRKLCGILVEAALESRRVPFAVVGVGLNVNLDPFGTPRSPLPPPASPGDG